MNKNRELVKNTAIISIGRICTQFVSFLLLPLYTSLLSTTEYGIVDLVSTYVQLLLPLFIFQMDQAVFRFLIDSRSIEKEKKTIISSVLGFCIGQCILFSVIFSVVNCFWEIDYALLFYINVLLSMFSSLLLQIARGLGDNWNYAVASFLTGLFTVLFNVIFIAVLDMRAGGMLTAMAIGNAISIIYITIKCKVYLYVDIGNISRHTVSELVKYSLPLVPNAVSWWLINAADRSIVLFFLGASVNGVLAASHKFSTVFMSFYNIFNISWTESAALHLKEEDRNEFFSSVVNSVYRIFVSACILIIAIMPYVFPIMINVNYSDAYFQIPIYMIAAMFNIIAGLYSVVYIAHKRTADIAKTSIAAGCLNVIFNLLLITHIGLYAASISSVIAYAFMAIYRHMDIRKYITLSWNKSILWSSIIGLSITLLAYYLGNDILKGVTLFGVTIYAFIVNKNMLLAIAENVKKKLKRNS